MKNMTAKKRKSGPKKATTKKNSLAGKTLIELSQLAMLQAAKRVREENKRFNELLIVWENNRIKKIPPGKY